jgi:PPM family protein phosphatase
MSLERSNQQIQLTAWLMRQTATSGVRRVAPIAAALATEVGEVRSENQDRIAMARGRDGLGRPFAIAALADGIGGMRQGADCAALALGSLFSCIASEAQTSVDGRLWLLRAMQQANNAVHAKLHGEGGSTLAAVLVAGDGSTYWASVGDSRVYLVSGMKLQQLSTDDTIAGQLGRGAEAGFEQSKLIQFIGIGKPLEAAVSRLDHHAKGAVFLTTDGVHFLDSTPWFSQLIKHAADPGICVRRLVELSKWCGGPDNASAAMVTLGAAITDGIPGIEGCLEVWDPFGELQLLAQMPRTPTAPAPASPPLSQEPAHSSFSKLSTDKTSLNTSIAAEDHAVPSAQKKNRPSRKSKSAAKERREDKGKEKSDVPQLLIEFPNKSN